MTTTICTNTLTEKVYNGKLVVSIHTLPSLTTHLGGAIGSGERPGWSPMLRHGVRRSPTQTAFSLPSSARSNGTYVATADTTNGSAAKAYAYHPRKDMVRFILCLSRSKISSLGAPGCFRIRRHNNSEAFGLLCELGWNLFRIGALSEEKVNRQVNYRPHRASTSNQVEVHCTLAL